MKKEYVKPVIEGEVFVANEYVAACWTITCLYGKCGQKNLTSLDDMDEIFNAGGVGPGVYTGNIGEKPPCAQNTNKYTFDSTEFPDINDDELKEWYSGFGNSKSHHPVTITRGANAS